ncbi:MAG: C69 family dipeptidase [Candidatus Aminicenantes bacterium]|nr:C69 family dipeptidase [Candidatus Aminicenantes bacterium]
MKKPSLIKTGLSVLLVLASIFLFVAEGLPEECTGMIAGRNTTVDGSILFVKSEDDGPREVDYLWYIPRNTYEPGAVIKLRAGGMIPQVKETYAYFWDQCPGTAYSNQFINEWGVAFGSNACASKEDSVKEVEARGDLINGGIGFRLRMILAQRAKTAREAVMIAARLLDKYGYSASGRNLNIVGPNEAWQLQMARGKNYVARRVKDDEVAIIANTFSIREVDMNDKDNFICSPELINYAIKRGWYDPKSGEKFDFAKAYSPERIHKSFSNTHRVWNLARLLNKNFPLTLKEAEKGLIPVSVKPDRKLTLKDVMAIFRDHYEGTPLDKSGFGKSREYKTSPHKTPHTICNYGTHRTTVVQQRNWMPVEIGTVTWRAVDQPCASVFVPWYLGATRIPEPFHKAPESLHTTQKDLLDYHFKAPPETWKLDMESASGLFACLGGLVDTTYGKTIEYVQKIWSDFEDEEFALQPTIEKSALELYKQDKELAKEFLSFYTESQALKSLEVANKVIYKIKWHLWGAGGQNKIRVAIKVDPKIYDEYVGEYDGSPVFRIRVIKKNDRLFCLIEDESQFEIFPESENEFFLKKVDAQISFVRTKEGKVTKLIVHSGGRNIPAKKIK